MFLPLFLHLTIDSAGISVVAAAAPERLARPPLAGTLPRAPLGSCGGGWCGRSRQGWEEEGVRDEDSERDMRQPGRKRERVRWRRSEF